MFFKEELSPDQFVASCKAELSKILFRETTEEHRHIGFKRFILCLTKFLISSATVKKGWPYNLAVISKVYKLAFNTLFPEKSHFKDDEDSRKSTSIILCDLFWLLDAEFAFSDGASSELLAELLSFFLRSGMILSSDCMINLEPELLYKAQIIASKDAFNKKIIRLNTALLYKQQRYNMLIEDSEAFSMVLFLLKEAKKDLFDNLMCLVGSFDLDANRVIDVMLGEWISRPIELAPLYLETLKKFNCPHVGNIIGLKLKYLEGNKTTIKSLLFISALLIRENILSLNEILILIGKNDLFMEDIVKYLFKVGLLMKGLSAMKAFPKMPFQLDMLVPYFEAISLYCHPFTCRLAGSSNLNTIEEARLYTHSQLVLWNNFPVDAEWKSTAFSLIQNIPTNSYQDVILLSKLLLFANEELKDSRKTLPFWLTFIHLAVWPLLHSECLPPLFSTLWDILKRLSFHERFEFYRKLQFLSLQGSSDEGGIRLSAKRLLKRLSIETVNTIGRSLAKLSYQNAFIPAEIILENICAYENFNEAVLESLKFWHPMALDILLFKCLDLLQNTSKYPNLSVFLGSFMSIFSNDLSIEAYLDVLIRLLLVNRADAILCISDLIAKMAGLDSLEEYTAKQLTAVSTSDAWFRQIFTKTNLFTTKHPNFEPLLMALQQTGLLEAFWLVLAQSSQMVYQTLIQGDTGDFIMPSSSGVKMTGYFLDQCKRSFLQFSDLMRLSDCVIVVDAENMKVEELSLGTSETWSFKRKYISATSPLLDIEDCFWTWAASDLAEFPFEIDSVTINPDEKATSNRAFLRSYGPKLMSEIIYSLVKSIYQRAVFSPMDAKYSADFLLNLTSEIQSNHSEILQLVFSAIHFVLPSLTQNESADLGLFFDLLLDGLRRTNADFLPKWIHELFSYFYECFMLTNNLLDELDYILRRNCLFTLSKMVLQFPLYVELVEILVEYLQLSIERETHDDLKLLMRRYLHMLKQQNTEISFKVCQNDYYTQNVERQLEAAKENLAREKEQMMSIEVEENIAEFRSGKEDNSIVAFSKLEEMNRKLLEETQREQQNLNTIDEQVRKKLKLEGEKGDQEKIGDEKNRMKCAGVQEKMNHVQDKDCGKDIRGESRVGINSRGSGAPVAIEESRDFRKDSRYESSREYNVEFPGQREPARRKSPLRQGPIREATREHSTRIREPDNRERDERGPLTRSRESIMRDISREPYRDISRNRGPITSIPRESVRQSSREPFRESSRDSQVGQVRQPAIDRDRWENDLFEGRKERDVNRIPVRDRISEREPRKSLDSREQRKNEDFVDSKDSRKVQDSSGTSRHGRR